MITANCKITNSVLDLTPSRVSFHNSERISQICSLNVVYIIYGLNEDSHFINEFRHTIVL